MMGRKTKQVIFIIVLSTIFLAMFFCSDQNFVMAEEKKSTAIPPQSYTLKLTGSYISQYYANQTGRYRSVV
jgi:di/tricarboxylate transporter